MEISDTYPCFHLPRHIGAATYRCRDMSAAIVSSIVSSRRDAIEKAYSLGVITEEEYHSKMQEYGNFSSQNGVSRKRPTPDSSGTRILVCSQWETLQTFESYEVALAYIKSDILGPIKWAKSTGKPGDRRFVCNAHEGCQHIWRRQAVGCLSAHTREC
jgi:hypothetical protein